MSASRDDFTDKIERIAAEAAREQSSPAKDDGYLKTTVTIAEGDCETPIDVVFVRDFGDTWGVHVGPGFFMAINNPQQGVVISRLVEMIASQRQMIIFDSDGSERDHV